MIPHGGANHMNEGQVKLTNLKSKAQSLRERGGANQRGHVTSSSRTLLLLLRIPDFVFFGYTDIVMYRMDELSCNVSSIAEPW